jgi:hypothetical protein
MKTSIRNLHNNNRPRTQWGHRLSALALLPLASLMILAPGAQAARPGGVAVLLPPFVYAPGPQLNLPTVSPFDIVGFIQTATVTGGAANTDYMAGGSVEVNGTNIVIPRNTIFQMPATQMTWADMFFNAPPGYKSLGQSGLALSDTPKPLTTYEIHIQGNRVVNVTTGQDQYIAGLVFIAQQSGTVAAGIINSIDYSKCTAGVPCMPDVWFGSTLSTPATPSNVGGRLRMNTISGRYGAPDANLATGLVDKRFTADEDNPTMATRTGYPICLPRFDPAKAVDSLCPQWNRPVDPFTGAYSVNYTMPAAPAGAAGADGITHQVGYPTPAVKPDPFEQAPLEVGDYITITGNLVQDAACAPGAPMSSCQYISAHTISAELGIYTAPGTWPVYSMMGEFRMGVAGTPNPIFPQEAVEKVFGDFFTTDNSQLVDVYAVDVNSTTGASTHRYYGSSDPFGPPLGGLKGRARFRVTVGNFLPPTRFMSVASRSFTQGQPVDFVLPTARLTANGLKAGYFEAPDFEFIFAENLILGSPQIPLTFQEFPFLANGSGPYVPWNTGGAPVGNVGQLSPWPNFSAPPMLANSTGVAMIQPPVSNAGPTQTVPSGSTVTLDASGSVDPNVPALAMIYTWQQIAGPSVLLLNSDPMLPTNKFTAPTLAPGSLPVVLTFQLAVCNGITCGGVASVNITVVASTLAPSVTFSASPSVNVTLNQKVTLTAAVTGGSAPLTYTFTQTAGTAGTFTGTGNTRSFTPSLATPVPSTLTFSVNVTDSLGRSSTATTNVLVGPDTITPLNVTYALAKSRLQVSATDSVPNGVAILTMTPLDANGLPIAAGIVLNYDPTQNAYILPLNYLVNPIPNSVRINSSLGGVLITPVQKIR